MIHTTSAFVRKDRVTHPMNAILSFVSEHYEALWHAARLLGGYDSARLVDRCLERLTEDQTVTPRARIMLLQIMELLSLEQVDDPGQPYMGYFAAIDPCDPVVEEICLLTDQMREVLCASGIEADMEEMA
ncbi:hypothetical protein [Arenibacterium halophilum]|uniref:Uncharacterized protein n=1 Tax=Arenibacterium halophilum TaxID=2583821 RepID=A0ABY2XC39_9RHOB|nr:hypothetical protein [Arenibacterium halophilum]TMV14585.1 hypothetical protein FGK64_00935 [Arenibacterium halophilum]